MTPFFSIIIPVYNVAPYLRECLDSVLAQTFVDWEAICVDDGSTDGSGTILDEYAAKDNRFKVIHQKNAGVSAARNVALANATGDWLLFLDGDDMFRNEALEIFVPYIESDMSLDGILVHPAVPFWDGKEIPTKRGTTQILVNDATKEDLFLGRYAANGFPFSRVYRRSLFRHLRFRIDIAMAEDICFWFDALCVDAKWMILGAEYYLYRQRPDSACGARNPHRCINALESVLHAVRVIDRNLDSTGTLKLQYLRRFPHTVVYYLSLAIEKYRELSCAELQVVHGKIDELEQEVGCWPFDHKLKLKLDLASSKRWSFLLQLVLSCENAYFVVRHKAGMFCRKIGIRKNRK